MSLDCDDSYYGKESFENYKLLSQEPKFLKLRIETSKLDAYDTELVKLLKRDLWKIGYEHEQIESALVYGRK